MFNEDVTNEAEVFEDETLICKDCGNEFIFSAGDKQFYKEKGFMNKPKACRACRAAKKNGGEARPAPQLFEGTCSQCGGVARVKFQPSSDRPLYCDACYAEIRAKREG